MVRLLFFILFFSPFVCAQTPIGLWRKPIPSTSTGPTGPGAFLINGITGGTDAAVDSNLTDWSADPTVNWGASTDATTYDVEIKDASGATSLCSSTGVASTSVSLTGCGLAIGGSYKAYVVASDGAETTNANNQPFDFLIDNSGTIKLESPTTGTDYIVPAGTTSLTVKLWGAAGGSGSTARGGGGGYATGVITTTPGETLNIRVGGGGYGSGGAGNAGVGGTNGGGTSAQAGAGAGGGGGGYSAVYRGGTLLIIAGGGGGSADKTSNGGPGGGTLGVAGDNGTINGGGAGTQVAGGTGSNGSGGGSQNGGDGVSLIGGDGAKGGAGSGESGGAGGAGYYGGGGSGGVRNTGTPPGGGGGGSSYANGSLSSVTLTAGTAHNPANTGDSDYVAGTGVAPAASSGSIQAGNGLVVLIP